MASVIAGLYACGNDMGSIMNGNYPGPGITLGPALTFGYIAGAASCAEPVGRDRGDGHEKHAGGFPVNTYSYIFGGTAADTVARLADQGYGGVELMFFPGHLWPAELDADHNCASFAISARGGCGWCPSTCPMST